MQIKALLVLTYVLPGTHGLKRRALGTLKISDDEEKNIVLLYVWIRY